MQDTQNHINRVLDRFLIANKNLDLMPGIDIDCKTQRINIYSIRKRVS